METATHFKARKKVGEKGFGIILYRFASNGRPEYKGPLGWSFHLSEKDSDIIPELLPIEDLEKITGDNIERSEFSEFNIYAG